MGKTAVIAEFGNHLGGLTSGGLGATDIGNKAAIGGIAREFYHRIALHYANSKAWRIEQLGDYFGQRGERLMARDLSGKDATMWTFEPHVAEDILFQMVNEAKVAVYFQQRLASVKKEGRRITEIAMENGKVYRAAMFVDASYEGDLMAKAGINYTVGREGNAKYHETLNGLRANTPQHQFKVAVDAYLKPGDPKQRIAAASFRPATAARQAKVMHASRPTTSGSVIRKIPPTGCHTAPPPDYDPAKYELLARYLGALVAAGQEPRTQGLLEPDLDAQPQDRHQ